MRQVSKTNLLLSLPGETSTMANDRTVARSQGGREKQKSPAISDRASLFGAHNAFAVRSF
jgi:hypothetical protein